MKTNYSDSLAHLEAEVQKLLATVPGCHDWDHTTRVLANARQIAREEGADLKVVECGALLHDIGRAQELQDAGKTCHAALGAKMVDTILRDAGFTDLEFIAHVTACVRTHRFRRRTGEKPASLEAQIVYDADKLDSIGAVGIGRAFHFAGRIGARLHNTEAEALASKSYSREDSAHREYLVKLRHIHEHMLTPAGRRLAEQRHHFMVAFFAELEKEVKPALLS